MDLLYFATEDSIVYKYGQSMNKIIDYMMAGKPILATYSGYQSMINEAKCGFFFSHEDFDQLLLKILELRDMTKQNRENIGNRGRAWLLKNQTYEIISNKYLEKIVELSKTNNYH